jgi:hypothetical protein
LFEHHRNNSLEEPPIKRFSFIALAVCLFALTAYGQQATTGSINGAVNDPNGAIVPGAAIILKNDATGVEQKTVSGEQGAFIFPLVSPGTYSIVVEAKGFKRSLVQKVVVDVSRPTILTVALELGSVNETVTVSSANQEIINTISPSLTSVVTTRQVVDLPLGDRNPVALAGLQPGIAVIGTGVRGASISGLRETAVNLTQDGINAMDNFVKTSSLFAITTPSLNSTDEFSITTGTVGSTQDAALPR